jgi:hypothetical protein
VAQGDWSREEVEATVDDYLDMLKAELLGREYSKTIHRRALLPKLDGRTEPAVEFKHANISAVLRDLGFPMVDGYKPRGNYQQLLRDVVEERLRADPSVVEAVETDLERPPVIPAVDDFARVMVDAPTGVEEARRVREIDTDREPVAIDWLARESHRRALGLAGEEFVVRYEQAALERAGLGGLASQVQHVSRVLGDGTGYDILSFEPSGKEKLIEVKTTRHGIYTPFFLSPREVAVSARRHDQYQLYRVFGFRAAPRMYVLRGSLATTCRMEAASWVARVR